MKAITNDELKALVQRHTFTQLDGTTTIVCLMELKSGAKVLGWAYGPLDPARFDFEQGCNIAYDKALAQLWDFEGYHRLAVAVEHPLTEVLPTEDMLTLPAGSAVFQIINAPIDGQANLDMRGVFIKADTYDPQNPAHRILAAIQNNIDDLVNQATGGCGVRHEDLGGMDARLLAAQNEDGEHPTDERSLSLAALKQRLYEMDQRSDGGVSDLRRIVDAGGDARDMQRLIDGENVLDADGKLIEED